MDNIQRDDVAVDGTDVLCTTNAHRSVMDKIFIVLNLAGRMDRTAKTMMCVLLKYNNDGTLLSGNYGGGVDYLEGI